MNPEVYFPEQKAVYLTHTLGLMLHIVGAMVANLIGPFLFLSQLQSHPYLKLHRWLGSIYLSGVLIGGLAGLYMAFWAYGGWVAQLGFMVLAVLWVSSGFIAYHHIRDRSISRTKLQRITLHREWMIRNYALTFSGATLRLWQLLFNILQVNDWVAYQMVAWLSWVPNLIVAGLIIQSARSLLHRR